MDAQINNRKHLRKNQDKLLRLVQMQIVLSKPLRVRELHSEVGVQQVMEEDKQPLWREIQQVQTFQGEDRHRPQEQECHQLVPARVVLVQDQTLRTQKKQTNRNWQKLR